MKEFWVASGHHLARRNDSGGLVVTDELLQAYLARPELVPPPEACAFERRLHIKLMESPRAPVASGEIEAMADADARENWRFLLDFRDRLTGAASLEAAYVDMARNGFGGLPPVFVDQLTQLILRNALEGEDDPFMLRAGELFFRAQRAAFHDGTVLLGDAEIIDARAIDPHRSPLLMLMGANAVTGLDVMDEANGWTYWSRSDAHNMVMNIGAQPRAREGLARVCARWISHLTGVNVRISPLADVRDGDWRWFIGLDAEGSRIGNALWAGGELGEKDASRVLALFRLEFEAGAPVRDDLLDAGLRAAPVYLILAMNGDTLVRMKPQNLIAGLPLKLPAHQA